MTGTLKLKNGLVMPSNFIEVKDDEMEYLDGGIGVISVVVFVLGIVLGCLVGWAVDAIVTRTTGYGVVYWFNRGIDKVIEVIHSVGY